MKIVNRLKSISFQASNLRKGISVELSSVILIFGLALIATFTDRSFIAFSNFINIMDVIILYLVLALGLTFVILTGSDNLAVGSMLSLNCVIFALLANSIGLWSIPLVLIFGFIEGLLTHWVFKIFKIPSFIATFGMMGVFTSVAVLLSGGAPIVISAAMIKSLRILHVFVLPGIKLQYLVSAIIFFIFFFIQRRTAYGKYVIAVGNSPIAARHMGVDISRVKQMSYALSGVSTAIGAIILCSRLYAGDPTVGTTYLLLLLAVVIVGGTSLAGGVGGVFNTLLGATTIAVLQNVLQIMGVNIYYHPVVIGAVMIIAVAISLDKEKMQIVK